MTSAIVSVAVAVLLVIVVLILRIVPDRSRFAVLREGRFVGLRGPGLLVKLPGQSQRWVRLSIGDKGNTIDQHVAAINGISVPIVSVDGKASDAELRVSGFRDNEVLVAVEKA